MAKAPATKQSSKIGPWLDRHSRSPKMAREAKTASKIVVITRTAVGFTACDATSTGGIGIEYSLSLEVGLSPNKEYRYSHSVTRGKQTHGRNQRSYPRRERKARSVIPLRMSASSRGREIMMSCPPSISQTVVLPSLRI